MQLFLEQLLNRIAMSAIYALVTLGLALVYSILRILHVAYASVYDAFMIICDGIRRAGATDGPAIQKAVAATQNYNGLTCVLIGFSDIGEVVKEVQVQIVKDGRFRHFGVV